MSDTSFVLAHRAEQDINAILAGEALSYPENFAARKESTLAWFRANPEYVARYRRIDRGQDHVVAPDSVGDRCDSVWRSQAVRVLHAQPSEVNP